MEERPPGGKINSKQLVSILAGAGVATWVLMRDIDHFHSRRTYQTELFGYLAVISVVTVALFFYFDTRRS
jgi:hypothetical protein